MKIFASCEDIDKLIDGYLRSYYPMRSFVVMSVLERKSSVQWQKLFVECKVSSSLWLNQANF